MPLIVQGVIVPMDRQDAEKTFAGRVYIDPSGSIEQVSEGNGSVPAGFADAPTIDVGDAFVLPGLIDLHNHIGYNCLPLWTQPGQQTAFLHHESWTRAASYQASISWPATALVRAAPEALLAYVQLRALVGGTTAIQGWPAANRPHLQVLRNIDSEKAGHDSLNLIYTSALTKKPLELGRVAQAQRQGAGFIYHCAEGKASSIVTREFVDAANAGCLGKTFIGVHLSALAEADWERWARSKAGAVAWSPFSNEWLYGETTNIRAARERGVFVCLGSDWGPSGTKNVQGEMKVAKLSAQAAGLNLTDQDLVAMVTTNPGDALFRCWGKTVGRLMPGGFGDLTVLRRKGTKPVWKQLVESTEKEIMLVVYNGLPRYGDAGLMSAAAMTPSATISVAGVNRRFAIADPANSDQAWTWKRIRDALELVRKDPKKAVNHAEGMRRAYAGSPDGDAAPLDLVLDMPMGGDAMGARFEDNLDNIKIPPLPSLVHDADFFESIRGRGFHEGRLDGLEGFYS